MNFDWRQAGSSLLWVMISSIVILGGGVILYKQKTVAKKNVVTREVEYQKELLDLQIRSQLLDIDVCNKNFKGNSVGLQNVALVDKHEKNFLEVDKLYFGGKIKIVNIATELISNNSTKFNLVVEYEKRDEKSLGGKNFKKTYEMSGHLLPDNTVDYCYMNENSEVDTQLQVILDKICKGPGVVGTADKCTVIEFTQENLCPDGETIHYKFDQTTQNWTPTCLPIFVEIGTNNQPCNFGVRFTGIDGKFECYQLTDLVDTTKVNVAQGANCFVQFNSQGKLQFSCGQPVGNCYDLPINNTCQPGVVNGFDYGTCLNIIECACLGPPNPMRCVSNSLECNQLGGCL